MKKEVLRPVMGLVAYVAVLTGSIVLLVQQQDSALVMRALIALAPMIPAIYLGWAVVCNIRQLDEMHLRIQLETLAFAFAASALLTFSYGFLENVGAPHLSWFLVWPIMGAMWMLGFWISKRRYQ